MCRVYQNVGAPHISVVRCIVISSIVISCFASCTQRTIYYSAYLSALDDDINIAHHSSLMVASKNYGNVKGRFVIIVIIVEITINIYINSTLDRHVRATHHTISFFRRLSSTYTNCREVSRFDFYLEALTSMWQSIIHLLEVAFC